MNISNGAFNNISMRTFRDRLLNQPDKNPEVNVDDINKALENGDKSAVETLAQNNIPYTMTPKENGYTVNYSYNGKTYNINYEIDFSTTRNVSDRLQGWLNNYADMNPFGLTKPNYDITKPSKGETTTPTEKKYPSRKDEFDYSVVPNLDSNAKDVCPNSNIINRNYDKLLDDISKIKPQLVTYMKSVLQKQGIKLTDDEINQCLNIFISRAVQAAVLQPNTSGGKIQSSNNQTFIGQQNPLDKLANTMNTVEDILDCIVNLIDTIDYQDLKKTLDNDEYLLNTNDYFLSEEEKQTKLVVKVENSSTMSLSTDSSEEFNKFVNCNAEHLKKSIRQKYPKVSDKQLNSMIESISRQTIEQINEFKAIDGSYSISDALRFMNYAATRFAETMSQMNIAHEEALKEFNQ